ncbi:MAG: hypothetical protein P4L43_15655 [Syntrophobacteraceae bacterium]|nr:hypothetical protein [Syntrophobacteraceae bacterium]
MKLTPDQLIYIMEIAVKNADAYSMRPIELFSSMKNRIEEEISDVQTARQGTQRPAKK